MLFFFGVFWKRLNAKGCLWAMVIGFVLGLFRMLVDTPVSMKTAGFENGYAEHSFWWVINNINFQYFSILITLVAAIVMVVVSYTTEEPDYGAIKKWWSSATPPKNPTTGRSRTCPSARAPMSTAPLRRPAGVRATW